MPKLPNLSPRKLTKFLVKNGFQLDHATGSHFIYFNPQTKRRVTIPKHAKDLPKGTIISILKESGFSKDDLANFFNWYNQLMFLPFLSAILEIVSIFIK